MADCLVLLLLRQVYYVGYAGLKQIDLSDDLVVAAVAADTWEDNMHAVEVRIQHSCGLLRHTHFILGVGCGTVEHA